MPRQIITGEKMLPIKYHGLVKHLIFECNNCHKQFLKSESYYRKQSKTRKHACCFCSPKCRSTYFFKKTAEATKTANGQGGVISTLLKNLFGSN